MARTELFAGLDEEKRNRHSASKWAGQRARRQKTEMKVARRRERQRRRASRAGAAGGGVVARLGGAPDKGAVVRPAAAEQAGPLPVREVDLAEAAEEAAARLAAGGLPGNELGRGAGKKGGGVGVSGGVLRRFLSTARWPGGICGFYSSRWRSGRETAHRRRRGDGLKRVEDCAEGDAALVGQDLLAGELRGQGGVR